MKENRMDIRPSPSDQPAYDLWLKSRSKRPGKNKQPVAKGWDPATHEWVQTHTNNPKPKKGQL